MLSQKIIFGGVAAIFEAIGQTGMALLGFGHVMNTVGQAGGSGPL